jgi:hypothetical protein
LTDDGAQRSCGAEIQHAGVPDAIDQHAGGERADQSAERTARGNKTEQTFRLLRIEHLEQETPEHRHQHQIQNADPDVKERADAEIAFVNLQRRSDAGENQCDTAVDRAAARHAARAQPTSRRSVRLRSRTTPV